MEAIFNYLQSYQLDLWQWSLVVMCSITWGLSKSGIKGVATIAVPVMAYVFGSKASTGVVVPMLIMADVMAVIYYNRHAQWSYLFKILPWTMLGVLLAVWIGDNMQEATFKQIMAIVIILSVITIFWWEQRSDSYIPDHWWFSGLLGIAAGFTTMIGNLAGAVVSIYLLTMRLPKNHFIGTNAWFFFIINVFKVPMHIFFWQTITWDSLGLNLALFPFIVIGFFLGVLIIGKINDAMYRRFVLVMTAVAAIVLLVR